MLRSDPNFNSRKKLCQMLRSDPSYFYDRYFMDKLMTQIAELAHQKLTIYQGNFSYYLKEKVKRQELLQKQAKNQQDKIAKTEAFIERFRYKNTKAAQVQLKTSKIK